MRASSVAQDFSLLQVVYIVFNTRDDFQCSVAFQLRLVDSVAGGL